MNQRNNQFLTRTATVCLLAMVSCLLWGSAFPCIKIGYRLFQIPQADFKAQILFAGCRFFLAGIMTVLLGSLIGRRLLLPKKTSWGRIGKLCLFQTVLQYLFFYIGLAHASGVKSSVIEGSGTFVTILIACLIFRQESLTAVKLAGCAAGFAGVVLVNLNGSGFEMNMTFLGEGFIFFAVLGGSTATVVMKSFSRLEDPVMLSGYQFLCGGAVLTAVGWGIGGRITVINGQGIAMLIYLGFLSAAAYSLWSILLKYNPVSRVSVFGFMNPIFGVILSAALLNERQQAFGIKTIIALLLVCAGIYIVNGVALAGKEGTGGRAKQTAP